MLQGVPSIKVHGDWLQVKAEIRELDGLSGHADYQELERWLKLCKLSPDTRIQLVHGEPEALETLKDYLTQNTDLDVDIPGYMSILEV